MNRRNFLAGSVALAGQHPLLRPWASFSAAGQPTPQLTTPQDLLANTYTNAFLQSNLVAYSQWHPYPRWSERAPWQAVPADIRAAFIARAEADAKQPWQTSLATTFLDFKRNGNRSRYETICFGRRARLAYLVLAECLEGQGRFLDEIANGVWLICEESFWGGTAHIGAQRAGIDLPDVTEPIVDLFAAETAATLAWTTYLLGDQLDKVSPLINKRIAMECERRVLQPMRDRDDFSWMGFKPRPNGGRLNNWDPWVNSNVLAVNLILESDPKRRAYEMGRIVRSLDVYLNQYWPDAGEEEGSRYFTRSPQSIFECLAILESATGNATGIFSNPFFAAMGRYIVNVHIAGGQYVNFGDALAKEGPDVELLYRFDPDGNLLYRYGKAVHDQKLAAFGAWCAAQRGWTATGEGLASTLSGSLTTMARVLPAVLQASEIRSAARDEGLVRDTWYPMLGLMTARVKANSTEGMYLAALAANNGRSHSHCDTGDYIVYQDGLPVAIDLGVEAYTAQSFNSDRYKIWTMKSAFHNLPLIGGVMQKDGLAFKAANLKYFCTDECAAFSFDIAAAYPGEAGVRSWMRTVTLNRKMNKVTVVEDFELEHAVPVSLVVITPRVVSILDSSNIALKPAVPGGKSCMLQHGSGPLAATVETVPLADWGLRMNWGNQVYRVLLNSLTPVAKGSWTYEFRPE